MTTLIPFSRDQAFLLPPDAKDWLPADDVAHFVVEAVERVPLDAFAARAISGGKAQYHPRLMLALLIYAYPGDRFFEYVPETRAGPAAFMTRHGLER
jgi:transposase